MAREEEVALAILRAIILSANVKIATIENLARKTLSMDQALVASCFDC